MKILETDRGYKKNIWEYIFEKNGGFPVIMTFFANGGKQKRFAEKLWQLQLQQLQF